MDDTLPLKIDGLQSLTRQLGTEIKSLTAAIEANTESVRLFTNSMESQAEAFRELTEQITAEPDEADNLSELLTQIHRAVLMVLERLPASSARHS